MPDDRFDRANAALTKALEDLAELTRANGTVHEQYLEIKAHNARLEAMLLEQSREFAEVRAELAALRERLP